jgi:hypothetical protein
MGKKRINISGWTEEHDKALQIVYKKLLSEGLPVDYNGEPNTSAILLYLLQKEARKVAIK